MKAQNVHVIVLVVSSNCLESENFGSSNLFGSSRLVNDRTCILLVRIVNLEKAKYIWSLSRISPE